MHSSVKFTNPYKFGIEQQIKTLFVAEDPF